MFTATLIFLKVLPSAYMFHSWSMVFKLPVPQIWRLVTNFTVVDGFSLNLVFQLVWLIRYGAAYESAKFLGNVADAIYMLLVGMIIILAMDLCVPFAFHAFWHGPSLIFMMLYLWSKQNPNTPISLFGIINLQAVYLPFALLALDVVQGGSPKSGIVGILAGHVYYFLTDVYPRANGRHLIKTPQWLVRLVYRFGLSPVRPIQVNVQHNPADTRFRAFQGSGRRLAD
ncbi:putative Derlin-1 [Nannochloris sp. 'desiccata']|nr:putative Derlin-1 [Chlorella desiccata (nom. nud.)]